MPIVFEPAVEMTDAITRGQGSAYHLTVTAYKPGGTYYQSTYDFTAAAPLVTRDTVAFINGSVQDNGIIDALVWSQYTLDRLQVRDPSISSTSDLDASFIMSMCT